MLHLFGRGTCGSTSIHGIRECRRYSPVVAWRCVRIDDDFISLAYVNHQIVHDERLNGHEIRGDNLQLMAVQRNRDAAIDRCIDQPQEMLLA